MGRKLELAGLRFGSLLVLKEEGQKTKSGAILWECLCDCGRQVVCASKDLRSGNTKSCGCTRVEKLSAFSRTHGMSGSRIYAIYSGMLSRCYNDGDTQFKSYGGRGILVSPKWIDSFENFYKDMASGYKDDLTLERIDVNGNYCKENCVWVSKSDQALNKTRYKNNKSGYTGISEQQKKYGLTMVAIIQNPATGKAVVKTRNLTKYSREDALQFLLEWLRCKRKEFGYKETHGSGKHTEE